MVFVNKFDVSLVVIYKELINIEFKFFYFYKSLIFDIVKEIILN